MRRRSSSDEQVISSSSAKYVRSYTCTFCKKGFSNAQALGGHMNIHRRDRAKLREERHNSKNSERDGAGEDQEEMAGTVPSLLRLESKEEEEEEEDRGLVSKGKRAVIHGQDELLEPLPLFVDQPTPAGDSKEGKATTSSVSVDRATEMDLELRLGIQPPVISIPRRKSL